MRSLVVAASIAALAAVNTQAQSLYVAVDPSTTYGVWQGWGVSLCWWANVLGESDSLAQVIWGKGNASYTLGSGQNVTVPSLNLNIARYNVGGSSNVTVNGTSIVLSPNFPWWKQIQGYWLDGASTDPSSPSWDWSLDKAQRAQLSKAAALQGQDCRVEFFSNSPMWWALGNHNPSGSPDGTTDNLLPSYWRAHAQYMATVATQAAATWGVPVTTVEPLNEPIATWWKADGTQEGCHFEHATQAAVLQMLRQELDARAHLLPAGSQLKIAASDESLTDMGLATWQAFDAPTRAVIDQVNVHGYQGTAGNRSGLYQEVVVQGGKELRLSEHGEGDGSGITLAQTILEDFHQLHPTSWVYWQVFDVAGGWALIPADLPNADISAPNPKYYALAQYSRHILPGMTILNTTGSGGQSSVAAYSSALSRLVVVATNLGQAATPVAVDLTAFTTVSGPVTRWATYLGDSGDKYAMYNDVAVNGKGFSASLPANTIVTYSIEGVAM